MGSKWTIEGTKRIIVSTILQISSQEIAHRLLLPLHTGDDNSSIFSEYTLLWKLVTKEGDLAHLK